MSSEQEQFVAALYRGILRREPDSNGLNHHAQALRNGIPYLSVVEAFINSKEFSQSATIKLFVPPGHFYSPIVDPHEAARYLDARARNSAPESLPGIAINRAEMVRTWQSLLPFLTTAPFPDEEDASFHYAFQNPSYSFGDGSVLHAMLRLYRPKRFIEIGSGYSSACTFDTVQQFLNGECRLTFIEPYPQLLRDCLRDVKDNICILDKPVQEVDLKVFDELESGDILFIDSTHILRTGSDVCFELFEILPRLAQGVLVHFHDMFWPFEYPRQWVVDENRSWNELYAMRAFLTNNHAWRFIIFNDYLTKLELRMIQTTYPKFLQNSGGSLWLQRR